MILPTDCALNLEIFMMSDEYKELIKTPTPEIKLLKILAEGFMCNAKHMPMPSDIFAINSRLDQIEERLVTLETKESCKDG